MNKNKNRPAKRGMTRKVQTVIILIVLVLPLIGAKTVPSFVVNRQFKEGLTQQSLISDQNHANFVAKMSADFKLIQRARDEDRSELYGVIERHRIEIDENLEDQRKELRQIKQDFQTKPDSP